MATKGTQTMSEQRCPRCHRKMTDAEWHEFQRKELEEELRAAARMTPKEIQRSLRENDGHIA